MKKVIFLISAIIFYSPFAFAQGYGGMDFSNPINSVIPSKSNDTSIIKKKKPVDVAENITVSYAGFDLKVSMTGRVSCGATFFVENNTPYKLSQFIAELDWTGIFTRLSFSDIAPNEGDNVRYRLLGDGCYTMVERPQITVLKCRLSTSIEDVKEMSFENANKNESFAQPNQKMISQEQCKELVGWRPPSEEN